MRKGIKQGVPSATKIKPAKRRRKPIDIEALRALTDSMPRQKESAAVFIRRMRDQERY